MGGSPIPRHLKMEIGLPYTYTRHTDNDPSKTDLSYVCKDNLLGHITTYWDIIYNKRFQWRPIKGTVSTT